MTSRNYPIDKKILCVLSKVNGCPTLSQTLEALGTVHKIMEVLVLDVLSPSAAVAYGKVFIARALGELAEISTLSRTHCERISPLVDRLFYMFDGIPQRSSERLRTALPRNERTDLPQSFFDKKASTPKADRGKGERVATEKAPRPLPEVSRQRKSGDTRKARMVAQEIVDSERRYVKGLEDLARVYRDPMTRGAVPLPPQEIDTIFSAAPEICALHTEFLKVLEKGEESVPRAFAEYMPRLRGHYVRYGKNFGRALDAVARLKRTVPGFEEFVQTQSKVHFGTAAYDSLGALLITPIQRLPRYRLLLGELSKCWAPGSSELLEAERIVSEIAEAMNDSVDRGDEESKDKEKEEVDRGEAARKIENVLSVAAPGRKLVRRGDFVLKNWLGVAKQGVHALLFVDTLLLTRKKKLGGQLVVVLREPLRNCRRVEEVPRLSELQMLAENVSHVGFSLVTVRGSIVLDARSKEERDEWVCDLRRLIVDARMVHLHARKSVAST